MNFKSIAMCLVINCFCFSAFAAEGVSFVEPKNKSVVGTKFHVKMALEGRKICEAGKETADKTCGHHHILIDSKPVATGEAIINDATHLHFGKGQTETDVTLAPGKHTLTLQLADSAHRSYGEKLSQTIEVEVK